MSTVSFASVLRGGAFSPAGSPEPFLDPCICAAPPDGALLRLRRRRAERLVPVPDPVVAVPEPLGLPLLALLRSPVPSAEAVRSDEAGR
jgi:hypothetical protein